MVSGERINHPLLLAGNNRSIGEGIYPGRGPGGECMKKVSIGSYMDKGNYGVNSLYVEIGEICFYFSYQECIAFRDGARLVCIQNYWSNTTGRHLNQIQPDKKLRVNRETFDKEISSILEKHGLVI